MPYGNMEHALHEQLSAWNPMKDDFRNSQFNRYSSGPGENIDPAAIQSSLSKNSRSSDLPTPYLVIKNIPKGMTTNAMYNICMRHGRVLKVRDSNKNDHYFVDLQSVADMEAVYRALENNTYGFRVFVGKSGSDKKVSDNHIAPSFDELPPETTMHKNMVDMDQRTYRLSKKDPIRPQISSKPIVSAKKYASKDNDLQRNDPKRHFLIEEDAHELERAGLHKPNVALNVNNRNKYRTGRAVNEMPEKVATFMKDKHQKSVGKYNSSQDKYQKSSQNLSMPEYVGKCAECQRICGIVCTRCSTHYCGRECQRKAWPKHRYVCGKPKELQVVPPPPTGRQNVFSLPIDSSPKSDENIPSSAFKTPPQSAFKTPPQSAFKTPPQSSTKPTPKDVSPITPPVVKIAMPRSGNLVTLTSISKTNVVFVRSKTMGDNFTFFKTVSEVQAVAKHCRPLVAAPKCGQIVVTNFEGQYNRAMVLNTNDLKSIKLVYIDYGNLDKKDLSELKEAPEHFVELPRLAIPVILKDVPDVYMTDEIRNFMYSYLDGIDLVMKYKEKEDFIDEKGVHRVELIDSDSDQNFNKMIATLSKPVEPRSDKDIIFREHLTQHLLPEGENIELIVMDNSLLCTGCISCTTKPHALEIQKFQRELQRYGESLAEQNYTPRVDELCIAKYSVDQKWYRGRCLEILGDGHPTIVFFDYGNISMVHIRHIRPYPPQFTYPIYTSDCEVDGLPEHCDEALVSKLELLIPQGSTINCERIRVFEEDKFHSITLPNVLQQLKEGGLLEGKSIA